MISYQVTAVPFEGNERYLLKETAVPFKGNDCFQVEETLVSTYRKRR